MAELKSQSQSKGGGEQNLTVTLRIRPMAEDEIIQGAHPAAYRVDDNMVVLLDPQDDPDDILRANRSREKQYVYDHTFDGASTQRDVYEAAAKFLIPSVTEGYNATVFAYGPTGAGKTYTMLGTDEEPGIMVQALNDLFLVMKKNTTKAFKVTMSYLEIYNEMIRDLLNPESGFLELREDAKGNVQVAGILEVSARSTQEVMEMLVKGNLERTQEPTAANATSSRSHAILQVTVKQRNRVKNTMQEVRTGRLFLVDLAGSERAANTHNRGKRMVEGAHINRSLLALGNCINALSEKNGPRYINYRDSKLTRLLKDALGGNCKTVMIAHISPASLQFEESRNTLVYADRAKQIKTKVRRNVTDVAYHIAQYSNIIAELREEITRLRVKLSDQSSQQRHSVANIAAVQSEVVESQRRPDKAELTHFKEQLLTSFKDQMELRRTLMELNNASMEISLETNRNQLIISEFEAEKASGVSNRETSTLTDNKYLDEDKENSVPGEEMRADPAEVQVARNELKVLHEEKHKTERIKTTIQKELETARNKTHKLEEMIPVRISNADQQEILYLLCRVHQLEIQSLEGQSAALAKNFQIRHKDLHISKLQQARNLSDDIIRRQKEIIDEHRIVCPLDLERLYDMYKEEQNQRLLHGDDISSFSSIDKVNSLSNLNVPSTPKISELGEDESNKVFTRSAKAKQIQHAEDIIKNSHSNNNNNNELSPTNNFHLAATHNNKAGLNSHSNNSSRLSHTDRTVINANTRNIAALAAKKKNRAHAVIGVNGGAIAIGRPLFRPQPHSNNNHNNNVFNDDDDDFDDFGSMLTPSRLAQHNHMMSEGGGVGEDNITDRTSIMTDQSLPPLKTMGSVGSKKILEQEEARRRVVRNTNNNGSNSYLEKSRQNQKNRQRRKISTNSQLQVSSHNRDDRGTSPNGGAGTDRPKRNTNNRINNARKNQKAPTNRGPPVSTPHSDKSFVSTPQQQNRKSKALPSIPQYRKGDIAVTGTSTNAAKF